MTALIVARTGHAPNAFLAFLTLEVRRAFRSRRYLMFAIGFPVVFYLLYTGVLSGSSPDDGTVVDGLPWRTFFLVSMATYGAIAASVGGAVIIAQERTSGWARQLRVTPLPAVAFVAGKVLVSMLVTVPAIVAVCVAGVAVNHVDLPAISWVQLVVTLAIGSLTFAALGLLIGYLFDSNSAQGAMMLTFFSLSILGGLWAPLSSFPETLATIGRVLPSFRLADLGRSAAAGQPPDVADLAILAVYTIVIGAIAAWRYRTAEVRTGG